MNEFGTFYTAQEVDYGGIVPAYQAAFAEPPWQEVSKCADVQQPQRCAGGMSELQAGELCLTCNALPTRPAYEADELVTRFTELGETRPVRWYIETAQNEVALAALCWPTTAGELAVEKYTDVPAMQPWLMEALGNEPFVYLDEIFRNRYVRPTGNLANLRPMLTEFAALYGLERVVYRSKQERLLAKTRQQFTNKACIVGLQDGLPDWRGRSVAIIKAGEAQ